MKKYILFLFLFAAILGITGCTPPPSVSGGRPIAPHLDPSITRTDVTYRASAEGDEIDKIRTWAHGLKYESVFLTTGNNEPSEDLENAEVYEFVHEGGSYPGFSYFIAPTGNCYLLIEGGWFHVTNPSRPPIPTTP